MIHRAQRGKVDQLPTVVVLDVGRRPRLQQVLRISARVRDRRRLRARGRVRLGSTLTRALTRTLALARTLARTLACSRCSSTEAWPPITASCTGRKRAAPAIPLVITPPAAAAAPAGAPAPLIITPPTAAPVPSPRRARLRLGFGSGFGFRVGFGSRVSAEPSRTRSLSPPLAARRLRLRRLIARSA